MSDAAPLRDRLLRGEPLRFSRHDPPALRSIEAPWIAEALRAQQPVSLRGALIVGPLDLTYVDARRELTLLDCDVMAAADFSFARFRRRLVLSSSRFHGGVRFYRTHLECDFRCPRTVFGGPIRRFEGLRIDGAWVATHAQFAGPTSFDDARLGCDSNLTGARFGGDVTFNGVLATGTGHLDGIICRGLLQCRGSEFRGDLSFDGAWLLGRPQSFWLDGTRVGGNASFEGARFRGAVSLNSAHCAHEACFKRTRFHGPVDAFDLVVGGNLDCEQARFRQRLSLVGAGITGGCILRRAQFAAGGKSRFDISDFKGGVFAQGVRFCDAVDFQGVRFGVGVRFHGAVFHAAARFEGAHFAGLSEFASGDWDDVHYPGANFQDVSFAHARFDQDARFDTTCFRGRLSCADTSFRSVYFSPAGEVFDPVPEPAATAPRTGQFAAGIDLRGCTYTRLAADWDELLSREVGAPGWRRFLPPFRAARRASRQQPYSREPFDQLETFLLGVGERAAADRVFLDRRRIERKRKWKQRDWGAWLLDIGYAGLARYGVKPLRLIVVSLLLLTLGCIYFRQPGRVADKNGLPAPTPWTAADAIGVSLHQFLPVDVPVGTQWIPRERPSPLACRLCPGRRPLSVTPSFLATLLLRLPGWILVPLGVAALTGLLRRTG